VGKASSVRYGGGDDHVLRNVLWKLWKFRCYWCMNPKDFGDTHIDHIIPKSIEPSRLKEILEAFALPRDYDLDDPRNLAPICATCNGPSGKGSQDLVEVPAVHNKLKRANALGPRVIKQVLSFRSNGVLAESLLRVSEADLSNEDNRKLFEEQAPAIVQRLALLGEEKADFETYRTEVVELKDGTTVDVRVSLNSGGRTAAAILENVCGCPLNQFLAEPVVDVLSQIRRNVQSEFEAIEGPAGPTNSGPPVEDFMQIDLDSIDFSGVAGFIEFTLGGDFEARLSASLVQDSSDGSEREELQGDAYVTGTFTLAAMWDRSMAFGEVDAGECWIQSWDIDVDVIP
jgi:hypothetical protein